MSWSNASKPPEAKVSRREAITRFGTGLASLALIDILCQQEFFASEARGSADEPGTPKWRVPSRAKRIVFFFMSGGPSQIETFDPKPALLKYNGKSYSGDVEQIGTPNRPVGTLMASPIQFQKHGESGIEISELFPHISSHADDLCVIRSMFTDSSAHGSACLQMNTGTSRTGHPALGAWVNFGLGDLTKDLPSFVVMLDPRGGPNSGPMNWDSAYLSPSYQGTIFRDQSMPLRDLSNPPEVTDRSQNHLRDFLRSLNSEHLRLRAEDEELAARIHSYEMAFKLQQSAAETVGIDGETAYTKDSYGVGKEPTDVFGRQCLMARRLLERGVRFVQIYSGAAGIADSWDGHVNCVDNHRRRALETDQPIAAFLQDLKHRGLFEDTIVVWGGEFGRTPTADGVGKGGRDHNRYGFSVWLAGGCIRGGQVLGSTDELGMSAMEQPCHTADLHSTLLHGLGVDASRLFKHDPRRPSPTTERPSQIIDGLFL